MKSKSYELHTKKKTLKRPLVIAGLAFLLITALLTAGFVANKFSQTPPITKQAGSNTVEEKIDYSPPTEEEKIETEAFKAEQTQSTSTASTPGAKAPAPTEKRQVSATLTSWGQNPMSKAAEISGFVSGVYEDNGTCTAKMTKNDVVVRESQSSTKDAKTLSCGLITIKRDRLSAGSWSVVIVYSSSTATAESQIITMEIE